MRFLDSLREWLRSLGSQRARAVSTVLGIAWGTFAVVALLAFSEGLEDVMAERARGLGSYFKSHDVGNRYLRWQVVETPTGQIAQLDWRQPGAGETENELRAPDSALRSALDHYDPDHHFIRFFVWADSFEVYLASRRIAEKAGFSVGWEAHDVGESLRFARSSSSPPAPVD